MVVALVASSSAVVSKGGPIGGRGGDGGDGGGLDGMITPGAAGAIGGGEGGKGTSTIWVIEKSTRAESLPEYIGRKSDCCSLRKPKRP